MKLNHLILGLAGAVTIAAVTGCVNTVDGRTKFGWPIGKDSIAGSYERTVPQVFEASKTVLAKDGQLVSEDTINKTLVAKVDTRDVRVKVSDGTNSTTVVVQARTRGGAADVAQAAQIEKEIALQLQTSK